MFTCDLFFGYGYFIYLFSYNKGAGLASSVLSLLKWRAIFLNSSETFNKMVLLKPLN